MYNDAGVYQDENMFNSLKANLFNLMTVDDDLICANIMEDMFHTIEALKIRLKEISDERDMLRRRAIKAEYDIKKAVEKDIEVTVN